MEAAAASPVGLDVEYVRKAFPAFKNNFVFMDNAGGSQTAGVVIDRITDYLINYDVQLGASYETSAQAGDRLKDAHKLLQTYINAEHLEEVVVGGSASLLLRILSICLAKQWSPGDEVIVTNSDHEANVSCWTDLQQQGIVVKVWKVNPKTLQFDVDDLRALMSDRTKLVAMVHASNILGTVNPIAEIAKVVHSAGALICVDGVAFAPHRAIDVREYDVDFYVFSLYKVYGPHIALMYGKLNLLREMDGLNHYFIGKDEVPYKFQPGNVNYELTYGTGGVPEYFESLYNHHHPDQTSATVRSKIEGAFRLVAAHEETLCQKLLDYLTARDDVTIVGLTSSDKQLRVPTISFVHHTKQSPSIVELVDNHRIGIRFGDFYAKKLIHDLGLEPKGGVVRVSLVHYNTVEEVDRLIAAFNEIL